MINEESIESVKIKSVVIPDELIDKVQEIIDRSMAGGTMKKFDIEGIDTDILIDDSEKNLEKMIEKFKSDDFSLKDIIFPDKGDER